jgi:AcrR family transcriptional regulator
MTNAVTHRERRRAQLRIEIIQAAGVAFASRGYEQFSIRKLAAELGCAPGTLYLYFCDKDDLLRAVVEESFAGLLKTLQAIAPGHDPLASLRAKLRAYIEFGLRNPDHYKCAFVLQGSTTRKRSSNPHPAFSEMLDSVRRCVETGVFGPVDIDLTSQVLWACIHGITSLLISRPTFPWVDKNELIDELIETAVAGITRRTKKEGVRNGKHRSRTRSSR